MNEIQAMFSAAQHPSNPMAQTQANESIPAHPSQQHLQGQHIDVNALFGSVPSAVGPGFSQQNSSESNKKSEVIDNKQATTASTNDINTIYTKFAKFPNANKEDNLPTDSEQQQQSNFNNNNNENNSESNTQTTIEHNFITDKTGKYFFKNISFFLE